MAALSADTTRQFYDGMSTFREYLMKASTTIYSGSLVCLDTNGLAVAAADTANYTFVGIADEQVTSAASGNYYIKVRLGHVELPCTSITQAMTGTWMYVVDSDTVDDAAGATNDVAVGKLVKYISTTRGIVDVSSSQAAATAGTSVSYATGATIVKLTALASVTVSAALDEAYENIDDHLCNDGDGTTSASPGTNREHFAKAINALGCGVSYRVRADGSGTTAKYFLSVSADYATGNYCVVSDADPTNAARQPEFYGPAAIGASADGWAYRVFRQEDTGVNSTTVSTGAPVFCGAAGIPAIAKPGAAGGTVWICGSWITAEADGDMQVLLPAQPNPIYTETHTVTAGEAAANLVDLDTGWSVGPASFHYAIRRDTTNIAQHGSDEVISIPSAGTVRIADGAATYNTTADDIIYFTAFMY